MSTRGNVVIRYEDGGEIYFYQHYDGYNIAKEVHAALSRQERWDDESYLARIIFSEMIKDHVGEPNGFGISPYLTDNNVDLLIVDCGKQQILRAPEVEGKIGKIKQRWSFKKFISEPPIENWYTN